MLDGNDKTRGPDRKKRRKSIPLKWLTKTIQSLRRQSRLETCISQVRHTGVVLSCLCSLIWLLTACCQSSWNWNVFGIQEFLPPLLKLSNTGWHTYTNISITHCFENKKKTVYNGQCESAWLTPGKCRGRKDVLGDKGKITTTMAWYEGHAHTFTVTTIHIGGGNVVNIAYTSSNSSVNTVTGYAGVLQLPSELHTTTEMADKFFHIITCELNFTTENANELYQNSK